MVCQMHSSGVLTLKIQTMPTDVNLDGNVFGGWIMSQIDIACGIRASQLCKCRVVTKAVTELLFEKPIQVSDLVHIYTQIRKIGKTSVTIYCDVWTCPRNASSDVLQKTCEATVVMVAVDEKGNPKSIRTE
ncbi:acyl-CoA thioesterase [Candidatus Liberibacter asiaticus]|nr:acyl-CoA thioesterase [Candidatus Liberibacter asiaticus]KAE9509820.1 putative acyl-CoA thioester hydrolase [Candidatus Liberibacter asiaticus]KAE9511376.1 putative acyl-CoA thioester hydrolase [Candidatus Liberibacter asiaticus]KAE9511952.1 putative acyl-CoA thioester hydrolase [Candidatus Liberibacter asiaticus]KAE9513033.1 putative acyl-CoA thioester hydrolase [Candidatus Liberibacter asiaticus]KAE9514115.1 putative acyl-CoA thioester hydrolase [Candidatus Liberibacter asiaticus]